MDHRLKCVYREEIEILNPHNTECPISYEELKDEDCIILTCCMYGVTYDVHQLLKKNSEFCPMCRQKMITEYIYLKNYYGDDRSISIFGVDFEWTGKELLERVKRKFENADSLLTGSGRKIYSYEILKNIGIKSQDSIWIF